MDKGAGRKHKARLTTVFLGNLRWNRKHLMLDGWSVGLCMWLGFAVSTDLKSMLFSSVTRILICDSMLWLRCTLKKSWWILPCDVVVEMILVPYLLIFRGIWKNTGINMIEQLLILLVYFTVTVTVTDLNAQIYTCLKKSYVIIILIKEDCSFAFTCCFCQYWWFHT